MSDFTLSHLFEPCLAYRAWLKQYHNQDFPLWETYDQAKSSVHFMKKCNIWDDIKNWASRWVLFLNLPNDPAITIAIVHSVCVGIKKNTPTVSSTPRAQDLEDAGSILKAALHFCLPLAPGVLTSVTGAPTSYE
jgi:hypothetical protein